MWNKRVWLAVALMCGVASTANAVPFNLSSCMKIAQDVNQKAPFRADRVTTILSASCVEGNGKHTLSYRIRLDVDSQNLPQGLLDDIKRAQIVRFCSSTQGRNLLDGINYAYHYQDRSGMSVLNTTVTIIDCR